MVKKKIIPQLYIQIFRLWYDSQISWPVPKKPVFSIKEKKKRICRPGESLQHHNTFIIILFCHTVYTNQKYCSVFHFGYCTCTLIWLCNHTNNCISVSPGKKKKRQFLLIPSVRRALCHVLKRLLPLTWRCWSVTWLPSWLPHWPCSAQPLPTSDVTCMSSKSAPNYGKRHLCSVAQGSYFDLHDKLQPFFKKTKKKQKTFPD